MKNENRKNYSKEFKSIGNTNELKCSGEHNANDGRNSVNETNFEDKHDKSSNVNVNMTNNVVDSKNIHETDCDRYTFQAEGDTKCNTGDKKDDNRRSISRHDVEYSISK